MIFISTKQMMLDIRANSYKINKLKPKGIIGIPRSGMMAAIMLSQELHIGVCSPNEYIEANGQDFVFYRHGKRDVSHPDNGPIIIVEDSCYNGSCISTVKMLRDLFPSQKFISACVYLEGPCKIYTPDLCLRDIRREALADKEMPVALYEWNLLDNYWNHKFLFDLDGVMCVNPPCDTDIEAYERYLEDPVPLHIPMSPSGNLISVCTYRIEKYRLQTESFLKSHSIHVGDLFMFKSDTIAERNKVLPAAYKASIYENSRYKLFIESDDREAQGICKLTGKPVYCTETGRMYRKG